MNIYLLLEASAQIFPNRIGLSACGANYTLAEIDAMAQSWGGWLNQSVADGPVLYFGPLSATFVFGLFGSAYSGRTFVPVNHRVRDAELDALLGRIDPAVFLTEPTSVQRVQDSAIRTGRHGTVVSTDRLPGAADPSAPRAPAGAEQPALFLFTSGTSAEPKAVVMTHANVFEYVVGTADAASAGEAEAVLVSTPTYHIAAVANVLSNIFRCRRIVLMPQFEAHDWLKLARQERVTYAMVVPIMLSRILDVLGERNSSWPETVVSVSYGGSKAPPGLVEHAMRTLPETVGLVNAFGLTETSSTVSLLGPADHRAAFDSDEPRVRARLDSVGRPLPGVQIEIRRPDGSTAAVNEGGELLVRGPQVSPGYLAGASKVDSDGWLHTGDGGYIDDDGFLFVTERLDRVIIRGGENISPREVEAALLEHPSIDEALVVGLPDAEWGEIVGALLVGENQLSADEVRSWARGRLSGHKLPATMLWVPALPRNEMGKVIARAGVAALVANAESIAKPSR